MFGFSKKALSAEIIAQKMAAQIVKDYCVIKPKLERLFNSKTSSTKMAAAIVSCYLYHFANYGSFPNKSEVVKLVVNNLYSSFLEPLNDSEGLRTWVDNFQSTNSDYAEACEFLHYTLDSAPGPNEAARAAFPFIAALFKNLTGNDVEDGFTPLLAAGGQEWFNEVGVVCGSMIFDAKDFIKENDF